MNCPNCKTRLSCGCQKRTATNGAEVCSLCIAKYEASIINPTPTPKNAAVKVIYSGPKLS